MTTPPDSDLRTTLRRLADSTTPLPVDDGLWQRGRAIRRRAQAIGMAAVLALIVSVGGVATVLTTTDREARTASGEVVEGGAVPSRIEDIPEDLEATTDLAVGRASAVFLSSGRPVVITATDGTPHRLLLPGRIPTSIALELSPDGRTLAFQQAADDGTRVALLDLQTGRVTSRLVHAGDELTIDDLTWSPRGTWLAWVASAIGQTPPAAGQLRPSGDQVREVSPPINVVSVAVADDGALALGSPRGALFVHADGDRLERVATDSRVAPGAYSPDGANLALSSAPGASSYTLAVDSGTVLTHPFPDGTLGESVVRPVGWMDDRLQVLLAIDVDGRGAELVVTTPEVDDTSTWRRSVGSVDPAIVNSVSLAVDLLPGLDGTSSQRLTHDFGDPLAQDRRDISWLIGLGVAGAVALLMGLRWLWRRRLG